MAFNLLAMLAGLQSPTGTPGVEMQGGFRQLAGAPGSGGGTPGYQDSSTGGTGIVSPESRIPLKDRTRPRKAGDPPQIHIVGSPEIVPINTNQAVGFGRPMSPQGISPAPVPVNNSQVDQIFAPYTQPPQAMPLATQHGQGSEHGFLARLKDALKGAALMGPIGGIAAAISPQMAHNAQYNLITKPGFERDQAFAMQQRSQGLNQLQDISGLTGRIPGTNVPTEGARQRMVAQESNDLYRQARLEDADANRAQRGQIAQGSLDTRLYGIEQGMNKFAKQDAQRTANIALRSVDPGAELTAEGKAAMAVIGLPHITHRPNSPDIFNVAFDEAGNATVSAIPRTVTPSGQAPRPMPGTAVLVPGLKGKPAQGGGNTMTPAEIERISIEHAGKMAGPAPSARDTLKAKLFNEGADPKAEWQKKYDEAYQAKRKELTGQFGKGAKANAPQFRETMTKPNGEVWGSNDGGKTRVRIR